MDIRVENLSFAYKEKLILDRISFRVEKDTLLCVLGKNGAGKSTLFKCILGVLKPKTGAVYLDQTEISQLSAKEISKRIAYIPQVHIPHFNYRVMDVVIMGSASRINIFSSPKKEDFAKAADILEYLGICDLADRGYLDISGGERQLVLIARAMLQDAKILIMDEPTSNLDYGNQIRVMKKIRQLSREGYIVILSNHNPQHSLLFSEKALILKDGKVLRYGDTRDAVTIETLENIYKIEIDIKEIDGMQVCVPIV